LTLDELLTREAIRATMARCTQAGDSLRAEEYAACFTEDGILQTTGPQGASGLDLVGRAAILVWQSGWREHPPTAETPRSARFARHNLTTCKIELTGPDTAKARTYWMVMTDIGPDHCGVYQDTFRKVGDEWLIAHRKVKTEWSAPDSHFVAARD
jgi:hypothetical protein